MAQPPIGRPPFTPLLGAAGGLDLAPRQPQALPSGMAARTTFSPGSASGQGSNPGAIEVYDRERYASNLGEVLVLTADVGANVSKLALPALPSAYRNLIVVRNCGGQLAAPSTGNMYFGFGQPATVFSVFRLEPDQIFLLDASVLQDDIFILCDAATGAASFLVSAFVIPQIGP